MSSSSFMESKRFRLLQDQRGTAIIEFAIVAAPFIALLLAVMLAALPPLASKQPPPSVAAPDPAQPQPLPVSEA